MLKQFSTSVLALMALALAACGASVRPVQPGDARVVGIRMQPEASPTSSVGPTAPPPPTLPPTSTTALPTSRATPPTVPPGVPTVAASPASRPATIVGEVHPFRSEIKTWPIVLANSFSGISEGWPVGRFDAEGARGSWSIINGKYRWEAKALQDFTLVRGPRMQPLVDFYATVEGAWVSGSKHNAYGLVFRHDGRKNYHFKIVDEQYFVIEAADPDSPTDKWTTLDTRTKTDAIRRGEGNRLEVIAQGRHFVFFINGAQVAEINDSQSSRGQVKLMIQLFNPDDTAVFEFDNFEVRAP